MNDTTKTESAPAGGSPLDGWVGRQCDHDKRFTGVFFMPPGTNGCVACAFEQERERNKQLAEALDSSRVPKEVIRRALIYAVFRPENANVTKAQIRDAAVLLFGEDMLP